jgi:hypothetical protein
MRKSIALVLLTAFATLLAGCVLQKTPVVPPVGALYTEYTAPLTVNFNNTKVSTKPPGSSSTMYIHIPYIDLTFAFDQCDIQTAAANGRLTTVHYADYKIMSVLGIFGEFTVYAYGE